MRDVILLTLAMFLMAAAPMPIQPMTVTVVNGYQLKDDHIGRVSVWKNNRMYKAVYANLSDAQAAVSDARAFEAADLATQKAALQASIDAINARIAALQPAPRPSAAP